MDQTSGFKPKPFRYLQHKPHLSNGLHWLLTTPGLYPSSLNNTLPLTIQKSITKGWREGRPRESQQAGWFGGPKRQTSVYPPSCLSCQPTF